MELKLGKWEIRIVRDTLDTKYVRRMVIHVSNQTGSRIKAIKWLRDYHYSVKGSPLSLVLAKDHVEKIWEEEGITYDTLKR